MKRTTHLFLVIGAGLLATAAVWSVKPNWTGIWEFAECWPHISGEINDCVFYNMAIRKDMKNGDAYTVEINIDGYQSMQRIQAKGVSRNTDLNIEFSAHRPDHVGPEYERGDLLLTLTPQDGTTFTHWHRMQPVLEENEAAGAYFKKAKDD